jgi:hypothetical protein
MKVIEESAQLKAIRGFAKFLAVFIIMAVAIFGDTAYCIQMQKVFASNGLLMVFAYIGAFTSVLSVGYLLMGKTALFEPGGQMLMAWIAFAIEMIVIALNILVVFNHATTGPIATWALVSPATPVVHMLLIGLVLFLSPELRERHKDMEMASRLRDLDRKHKFALAEARMAVKEKQLGYTVIGLHKAVNSEESQSRISQHATKMNDDLLTEMSGRTLPKDDKDESSNGYYGDRGFGRR